MVDENELRKQYTYKATSNLVMEQDRHGRQNRLSETNSVGQVTADNLPGRMGDLAHRDGQKDPQLQKRLERRRKRTTEAEIERKSISLDPIAASANVVDVADELELGADGVAYVPTTKVAQKSFEELLAFVLSKLGDQPRELLRSAADEVLTILKDDRIVEMSKQKQISQVLATALSADEFARLSALGKDIKDFDEVQLRDVNNNDDINTHNQQYGNDGIAVVMDEEDENDKFRHDDDGSESSVDEIDANIEVDNILDATKLNLGISKNAINEAKQDVGIETYDTNEFDNDEKADQEPKREQGFDPMVIDDEWLEKQLQSYYSNDSERRLIYEKLHKALVTSQDDRFFENELVTILGFDKIEIQTMILEHRKEIVFRLKFLSIKDEEERRKFISEMKSNETANELSDLIRLTESTELNKQDGDKEPMKVKKRSRGKRVHFEDQEMTDIEETNQDHGMKNKFSLRKLDLENLAFERGGRLLTARDFKLPEGSEHVEHKEYEEWYIPPTRVKPGSSDITPVPINTLPTWAQTAFPNTTRLNRMQSHVFPTAFRSDQNMLVCAPTGAGKTNVAVLTILRAIRNSMPIDKEDLDIEDADLSSFKIVYVAPMKALVAEVVENLGRRMKDLGIVVRELTGDVSLSSYEISETQIIVTTPEKWDIITRKSGQRLFTSLVRLLIVDEIHLLHNERGPVLETIVARTLRNVESMSALTRIIGLSATLPNYQEVAAFLRVDLNSSLFHFDLSHRPCPLQQTYVGISARKALKRFQLMNELTYEKIKTQLQSSNQVIVFVHSRKETTTTCKYIIEKAIDEEFIDSFLKPGTASYEVIQSELLAVNSKDLSSLLERGLATHHAGMTRKDRELVESLFAEGHIKVLVSTATLAWGVNLPADTVIIKGTQVYAPELGRWTELSMMDVMQMMGRAGRPQYADRGEGVIITTKSDVLYYLSLLNNQLPIESQFVSRLVDMFNAEVAMGSVSSVKEGALWLCYTYLYVRMMKNPTLYGIPVEEQHMDPKLERRRQELIHTAALDLMSSKLVKYNRKNGEIESTGLGRVAADFYISNQSMYIYLQNMRPTTSDIDLLRIFSLSTEFKHIRVREEERLELSRLAERVPIPVKDSLDEPIAKVNVLLQSYISNLALDGLALKSDMIYISQSAARLTRALLHVAVQTNNAALFTKCLRLCKAVSARQWVSQTPLRQFKSILGKDVLYKIERKDLAFERYLDFTVAELGDLLRSEKLGRTVHRLVHSLPLLHVDVRTKPLARSRVELDLTLSSDFNYDRKIHGSGEAFWITIEDTDSELLLHSELFYLRRSLASEEHRLIITVPLTKPLPPHYYVRCTSDRWIAPECIVPVSFNKLLLPEKHGALTILDSRYPVPVEELFQGTELPKAQEETTDVLAFKEALSSTISYFTSVSTHFSTIQTHVFPKLFESNENTIIATLPGQDRRICGEIGLSRLFCHDPTALAVWVVGRGEITVDRVFEDLSDGLGKHLNLRVFKFIRENSEDYKNLKMAGTIIVTTAIRWDMFSRRWRRKKESKILARVGLVILDGINHVGDKTSNAVALEVLTSRMRNISVEAQEADKAPLRIIGLSDPIANASDLGQWVGAPSSSVFSFHPSEVDRNLKVIVSSSGFRVSPVGDNVQQLARPVFRAIRQHTGNATYGSVVFVPSKRLCRSLAVEMCELAAQGGDSHRFLKSNGDDIKAKIRDLKTKSLRECVQCGVGFIHDTIPKEDKAIVEDLFLSNIILVVVATPSYAWRNAVVNPRLVVIAGTSREQNGGLATRRSEYAYADILRMLCLSRSVTNDNGKRLAVAITEPSLQEHYKAICMQPIPIESYLLSRLPDHLNAEISSRFIETKQEAVSYLTWTFFYHRLQKNPNYYGLKGLSHIDVSNYLSELVETSLSYLEGSKCVAAEGEDDAALGILNLGIIASHYYMRHETVECFTSSLTPNTRLRGLLDVLSLSSEFDELPVRIGDEEVLRTLSTRLPFKLEENDHIPSYSDPHVKAHLLLQAHLTRTHIPQDLLDDKNSILQAILRLLQAGVDIIASAGWLEPAIIAIRLSQMTVQAIWDVDYPIAQLPHFTTSLARKLSDEYKVNDVFDFLEMDALDRSQVLANFSTQQQLEVDAACQQFPNLEEIEIESITETKDKSGTKMVRMVVLVTRAEEEPDSEPNEVVPLVIAPRYPEPKEEGWWLIVGDPKTNSLLTVKHFTLKQQATVKLEFTPPSTTQRHKLRLHLLSNSYIDCDETQDFFVSDDGEKSSDDEDDEDVANENTKMEE